MRQLRVLVESLPQDSATGRARQGHDWVESNYELADLVDAVNHLTAVTVAAHSDGHVRATKPYPRPEQVMADRERQARTTTAVLAHLDQRRKEE